MTRGTKALGPALLVLFAMGAIAASAAQAEKWTAASYPAIVTGDQDSGTTKFIIGKEVRVISCKEVLYETTITEATESISLVPHEGSCTSAPGAQTAHENDHNCRYKIRLGPIKSGLETCPKMTNVETGHGPIEKYVTDASQNTVCAYSIVEQEIPGTITAFNKAGPPEDVTLQFKLNPVTTVTVGSAIACGAAAGNTVSATFEGATTLRAYKDESGKEGLQVGLMIG